jgi:hypothetical protein
VNASQFDAQGGRLSVGREGKVTRRLNSCENVFRIGGSSDQGTATPRLTWAEAYRLAVLGVDQSLRVARIREAKTLMHARLEELTGSLAGQHELTALNDALVILRVWEKDVA